MRLRSLVLGAAVAALLVMGVTPATAGGPSFDNVSQKRFCFQAGPSDFWHCFNPGQGQGKAASLMVFDDEGDNDFLGVESLLFLEEDTEPFASGVPCPKDTHSGEWEWVAPPEGPPFWACHHWKGAPG